MRLATIAFGLLAVSSCSGTPSGPGPGTGGATGSIYISWRMPDTLVDTDMQVYRVSAADGHIEEVAIPYYTLSPDFDVDQDGSGLLFRPPAPKIAWMPGFDPSQLVEPVQRSYRQSPHISPDLNSIASIVVQQFIPRQIRILDMGTGVERVIGTMPDNGGWRIDHWFTGGDSLLVSWSGYLGRQEHYVAQADGSGITPFDFPLARHAIYLAISPDESRLAISTPQISDSSVGYVTDTIQVVALDPPRLLKSFGLPYRAGPIAWSPDGKYLAHIKTGVYSEEGYLTFPVLEIIDVQTGERTPLVMDHVPGSSAWNVKWARK